MKSRNRLLMFGLATSLVAVSLSSAGVAKADPNALRAQAQAEVDAVTVDIDQANIMFSPADNGTGASFARVVQYQQEYEAGLKSFNDGRYAEALSHLSKADELIRSEPDWTQSE
jgi:hypothetical protein